MAILPIYNCFHPVLKKKTEPVTEIDRNLLKTIEDMFETMHVAEGIGLAANQVGISKSFLTVDIAWFKPETKYPPLALINPVIEFSSDENSEYEEGCLSIPTLHEIVIRSKMIQVRYFDKEMKEKTLEADDLLARVLQHEIDHLNGILFYERVTPIRRTLAKNKLKKIQKGLIKPDYQMIMADGRYL